MSIIVYSNVVLEVLKSLYDYRVMKKTRLMNHVCEYLFTDQRDATVFSNEITSHSGVGIKSIISRMAIVVVLERCVVGIDAKKLIVADVSKDIILLINDPLKEISAFSADWIVLKSGQKLEYPYADTLIVRENLKTVVPALFERMQSLSNKANFTNV